VTENDHRAALDSSLAAFGAELGRWPAARAASARERLLRDRDFRRDWEAERALDRLLAGHRDEIEATIRADKGAERLRRATLARLPATAVRLRWRELAAAMLVAAMLGAAADLLLDRPGPDAAEVAGLDALLDDPTLQ